MKPDDSEILVMCQVHHLLTPYDRDAQERIVGYVVQRLAAEGRAADLERAMNAQQSYAQEGLAGAQKAPPINYAIGRL